MDRLRGEPRVVEQRRNARRTTTLTARMVSGFGHLFLPEGYPDSVSPDYTAYQVCDTVQALCSSVTGTLSTRAILRGVGVGDAEATALGGLTSWVIRDGAGMVGRVAFAAVVASNLDNDAKRWRLVADITNDLALALEVFTPYLPAAFFLPVVCAASLLKAITGVAGGATRASLTQHFAQRGNTADVSAKDGSQETAVSFLGMFLGLAVAAVVPQTALATAAALAFFTALHLGSNYYGVRALVLHHLNEERLLICVDAVLRGRPVPTPAEASREEGAILKVHTSGCPVPVALGLPLRDALSRRPSGTSLADATASALERLQADGFVVIGTARPAVVFAAAGPSDVPPPTVIAGYLAALHAGAPERYKALRLGLPELTAAGWSLDRVQLKVGSSRVVLSKDH